MNEKTWRIARIAAAIALAVYFGAVLAARFTGIFKEFTSDGDQCQGAWQYWRYHVDGSLPPGQLLTDYAFAYHSPPFELAWMATLSTFIQPISAAKLTHVLAWALLIVAVVVVVGRRTDWLFGIAAGFIAARNPEMTTYFGTGIARTWGPLLCVVFLGAFLERRHYLCLFLLVLAAGLYPPVAMAGGLTYGAYTVLAGPMAERKKRMASMFVAGLLIIGLGKYQDLRSPSWWGPLVTLDEAATMPAWRAGGRFAEVPLRPFVLSVKNNFGRAYRYNGHLLGPKSLSDWFTQEENRTMALAPFLLAGAVVVVDRVRRRRAKGALPPPDDDMKVPWQPAALIVGSIISYEIARIFAFKFFMPQRQLTYIMPWCVITGLPILAWCAARALVGNRRLAAIGVATAISVLPVFVLRGDGLEKKTVYVDHTSEAPLWNAIRELPLDANIAADNYIADTMGMFTWHAAWANRTMTHPWRRGLYDEEERRLVETSRALYATSYAQLAAFGEKEHVDYFIYNVHDVEHPEKSMFQPVKPKIEKLYNVAKGRMALATPPPAEAVVFTWKDVRILDLKKLKSWVDANPTP